MNTSKWLLRACLCLAVLQVISCTKSVDTTINDSTTGQIASEATVAGEFDNCKLRKIIHGHYYNEERQVTGLFTYSNGNPVSLTYEHGAGYNHYFFYDKQSRLREYRIAFYYPNEGSEYSEWHRYGYNSNNQIVLDTMLRVGNGQDPSGSIYQVHFITTLTYDAKSRIVKESIRDVSKGTTRNPTYTYDARGNLSVNGWKSSSYDNKVSIFRAHPVFQFIHRNYSVNNAALQVKYNSKGLPLSWSPANDYFFDVYPYPSLGYPGGITKAIYDCP